MEESLVHCLDFLGLKYLNDNWHDIMKQAQKRKPSFHTFLTQILHHECALKTESRRLSRLKSAKIPEMLVMETFPFTRQPKLNKKLVLQIYDSLSYIHENIVLLFVGPTGCGKTGLATSFLVHAINNNYRGLSIDFKDLVTKLYQSGADHSTTRLIKKLANIDCLLIDEFGYSPVDEQKAGLFFDLIKTRHKRKCTIITSQLGFDAWKAVIPNQHLNAAVIDRITENCAVFNMTNCVSLRKKKILYGAQKDTA